MDGGECVSHEIFNHHATFITYLYYIIIIMVVVVDCFKSYKTKSLTWWGKNTPANWKEIIII